MSVRTFSHALTGRSIRVREGSNLERLVEGDENYTEVKQSKSSSTKEAGDGSGNAAGRGGSTRKAAQRGGSRKGSKSAG